ncbi:helix-turn-helix domain-containing protein [Geminicoccus harenae]|uniref:helix-turn-helix domain-containing protein n=1 Tax=Geminicoccus harenae TaxID=2498453 RepID=UPI00168BDBAC|nr:helix-turn-helix domain-containing protein [Geminicoccus harenae]
MVQLLVLAPATAQSLLNVGQGPGVAEEPPLHFTLPAAPAASRGEHMPWTKFAQNVLELFHTSEIARSGRVGQDSALCRRPRRDPAPQGHPHEPRPDWLTGGPPTWDRRCRRLTSAGEAEIERRIQAGEPAADIARSMGVQPCTVANRRKKLGEQPR